MTSCKLSKCTSGWSSLRVEIAMPAVAQTPDRHEYTLTTCLGAHEWSRLSHALCIWGSQQSLCGVVVLRSACTASIYTFFWTACWSLAADCDAWATCAILNLRFVLQSWHAVCNIWFLCSEYTQQLIYAWTSYSCNTHILEQWSKLSNVHRNISITLIHISQYLIDGSWTKLSQQ